MNTSNPLNGANARTFCQCANYRDLLVSAENVWHRLSPYHNKCITIIIFCQAIFLCYTYLAFMGKKKDKKHSKKNAHTQNKNTAKDEDLANKRGLLRAAISHALSSGWVQNSTIAFVGAFVLLVAAMVTNTQVKTAAVAFALMGTAALWITAAAVIRYAEPENPPFAVALETALVGLNRDNGGPMSIAAEYNGRYLCPVTLVLFMRLVNRQQVPATISKFAVDVKLKKRGWWDFRTRWLKTTPIPDTMRLLHINPPPTAPVGARLDGPRLEQLINNRPVAANETVRGWILLDVPAEYDESAYQPILFRVSVKDTAGNSFTALDSGPTGEEHIGPQRGLFFDGIPVNIAGHELGHIAP